MIHNQTEDSLKANTTVQMKFRFEEYPGAMIYRIIPLAAVASLSLLASETRVQMKDLP